MGVRLHVNNTVQFTHKLENETASATSRYLTEKASVNDKRKRITKDAADIGITQAQYEYAKICYQMAGDERKSGKPPVPGSNLPATYFLYLKKARDYFKKAADQGWPKAQYNYAIMCLRGEGGPVLPLPFLEYCSPEDGKIYLSLAFKNGIWSNETRGAIGVPWEYGTRFTVTDFPA